MLIALLKKLAVPVPIIGVVGAGLIRFERQRQEKRTAKAVMYQPIGPRGRRPPDPLKRRLRRKASGASLTMARALCCSCGGA